MTLSEFARGTLPRTSDRVTAGLLTALVYAGCALLMWFAAVAPPAGPAKPEILTTILREVPRKPVFEPAPPVPEERIRPRAEQPAPPVVTIASGAPPQAPAPLPASAATSSPLMGGTAGHGPMGQAASGNGTDGNGAESGGCLDPVWMRAVSERVRQFYYYPDAALASRTTGVVTMRFGVRRDGRLDRLEVGTSSGDAGLDKAATDILQKAQPLPPIPDRMKLDRVDGELPINFGVRSFNANPNMGNCNGR